MDEYNYVADNGDGRWIVVVNGGAPKYYNSQGEAENAFNAAKGGGGNKGGGDSAWSDELKRLWEALVTSNQQDFDEKKRQFDAQLALEARRLGLDEAKFKEIQRQFDIQLAEDRYKFQYSQYGDMAKYVLGLSAGYTAPQDMFKYMKAVGGGQDLFNIMGSEGKAVPAFGAGEYVQPGTIADLMGKLGIKFPGAPPVHPPPEPYPPGGGTPAVSDDTYLDYIWSKRPDLKTFFESNGWDVSTPEGQRKAVRHWMTNVDPASKGKTPQQIAEELGYKPPEPDLRTNDRKQMTQGGPDMPYQTRFDPRFAAGQRPAPGSILPPAAGGQMYSPTAQSLMGGAGVGPYDPRYGRRTNFPTEQIDSNRSRFLSQLQRPASTGVGPDGRPYYSGSPGALEQVGVMDRIPAGPEYGQIGPGGMEKWPTIIDDDGQRRPPSYIPSTWQRPGYGVTPPPVSIGNPSFRPPPPGRPGRIAPRPGEPPMYPGYRPTGPGGFVPYKPGLRPVGQGNSGAPLYGPPPPIDSRDYAGNDDSPDSQDYIGPAPKGIDPYIWRGLSPEARALWRKQGYLIEDPHQQDIGRWESMTPEQRSGYLAASEHGLARSGYKSADEYMRQLNAARPKGTAPRQVNYSWSNFKGGY